MSQKKPRLEWTLRFCHDWGPLTVAYKQTQLRTDLGTKTVEIKDPIWVATLPNGNVLSLGTNRQVNPTGFERLTLFYSTPEARLRRPKRGVVPPEAKHHKYSHSIELCAVRDIDMKDVPPQDWAEDLHTFWSMVDRETVREILLETWRRITPKMPPQIRLILRAPKLPPAIDIRPTFVYR